MKEPKKDTYINNKFLTPTAPLTPPPPPHTHIYTHTHTYTHKDTTTDNAMISAFTLCRFFYFLMLSTE